MRSGRMYLRISDFFDFMPKAAICGFFGFGKAIVSDIRRGIIKM